MSEYKWIVKYVDGSTFTNLDGPPDQAPRGGVIGIAEADEEAGRRIRVGYDFYFWLQHYGEKNRDDLGFWAEGTVLDLDRYLDLPGYYKVRLRGQYVQNDLFKKLHYELTQDDRLPSKSADDRDEEPETNL